MGRAVGVQRGGAVRVQNEDHGGAYLIGGDLESHGNGLGEFPLAHQIRNRRGDRLDGRFFRRGGRFIGRSSLQGHFARIILGQNDGVRGGIVGRLVGGISLLEGQGVFPGDLIGHGGLVRLIAQFRHDFDRSVGHEVHGHFHAQGAHGKGDAVILDLGHGPKTGDVLRGQLLDLIGGDLIDLLSLGLLQIQKGFHLVLGGEGKGIVVDSEQEVVPLPGEGGGVIGIIDGDEDGVRPGDIPAVFLAAELDTTGAVGPQDQEVIMDVLPHGRQKDQHVIGLSFVGQLVDVVGLLLLGSVDQGGGVGHLLVVGSLDKGHDAAHFLCNGNGLRRRVIDARKGTVFLIDVQGVFPGHGIGQVLLLGTVFVYQKTVDEAAGLKVQIDLHALVGIQGGTLTLLLGDDHP